MIGAEARGAWKAWREERDAGVEDRVFGDAELDVAGRVSREKWLSAITPDTWLLLLSASCIGGSGTWRNATCLICFAAAT
jgi:hypothetical protein